jgi:hypothetical protein
MFGISRLRDQMKVQRSIVLQQWWDQLRASPRAMEPLRLIRFGRKGCSQGDEDGLILEIFQRIGEGDRRFVEFGVQSGEECNTALLLMAGWSGLWLEGSGKYAAKARQNHAVAIAQGRLTVREMMVTAENIDGLIAEWAGGPGQIDLLSIDIDGADYWVWEAITSVRPRVVVMEYNAAYPPPVDFVTPYDPAFAWDGSNYHGASLAALERLGREKGYALVGCCLSGANAFFVREDELTGADGEPRFCAPYTAANHYEPPRFDLTALSSGHPPRFGINAAFQPPAAKTPS